MNHQHTHPSNPITTANINWQTDDNGRDVPISTLFNDVYFSRANGLAESQHVFLAGNQLAERLSQLQNYGVFNIGELGFGTGLNFLAVWQLWRQVRVSLKQHAPHARLHIVSTEKYPLTHPDLRRALASFPELTPLSKQLLAQYPPALAGCHRLIFAADNLSLDLWLGDASHSLAKMQAHTPIDVWFLDGFAPKHNHSLWADNVLDEIKRLSTVGTTATSFSVAGVIKRGLNQRGFSISKPKGFGHKREMLTAVLNTLSANTTSDVQSNQPSQFDQPDIQPHALPHTQQHIGIVGAGVAGLTTAHAFALRGHQVTLFDKAKPISAGSGNPRALLAPKLTAIHKVADNLHITGFLSTMRLWQAWQHNQPDETVAIIQKTGVVDLLKVATVTAGQVAAYPSNVAQLIDAKTATALTGCTFTKPNHNNLSNAATTSQEQNPEVADAIAAYLPNAGLLNTRAFADYILAHPNIHFVQATASQIQPTTNQPSYTTLSYTIDNKKYHRSFDHIIICTAQDCHLLHNHLPKPRFTRGQVSWFNISDISTHQPNQPANGLPKLPLKYGGYCGQFIQNGQSFFMLGSTFIRGENCCEVTQTEHQQNLDKLLANLPQLTALKLEVTAHWQGKSGLRAQMPDYLPLLGQVDNRIWVMAALGSKGYSYATILAETLAGQVLGDVLPLSSCMVKRLNPLRFVQHSKPSTPALHKKPTSNTTRHQ